jgi:sugar transferase (PEP-CTERM system associated)
MRARSYGSGEFWGTSISMARIFKHHVPRSLLLVAAVESAIFVCAFYTGIFLRWGRLEDFDVVIPHYLPQAVTFVFVVLAAMYSQGLYSRPYVKQMGTISARLLLSIILAVLSMTIVFYAFPQVRIGRSPLLFAIALVFPGVLAVRFAYFRISGLAMLKRRVLVLGTGENAARMEALEKDMRSGGFAAVGYVSLGDCAIKVSPSRIVSPTPSLSEFVKQRRIDEIVVALQERRGTLPLEALLECRLRGVKITDQSTFLERETGRVELDALYPGWLIFSDGFPGGRFASIMKRTFDIVASIAFLVLTWPVIGATAIAVRLEGSGPILYRQERVGRKGRPFTLLKFRSMHVNAERENAPQWAAVRDHRVTRVGAFIRKIRVDEIPQVFNVLGGSMSFIGPRPERPYFVAQLSKKIPYYSERHRVKPGITGWAQLHHPYGASEEDAKEKLQYELYYIKNYSLFLDLIILAQTAQVIFWPRGVR